MADVRESTWPATVDSIAPISEGERPAKSYKVAVLIHWYNNFVASYWNNTIGLVVPAGGITVTGTSAITGAVTITSPATGTVPLTVQGYSASQTANIVNINKTSGTPILSVSIASIQLRLTDNYITTDTSDAADNKSISIEAGGATGGGETRGAYIRMYGNEYASTGGNVTIATGNNTGAYIGLCFGSSLKIGIETALITNYVATTIAATKPFTVTSGATSLTGLAAGSSTACTILTGHDSNVGLIVRRNSATQTADLLCLQTSTPTTLTCFDNNGWLGIGASDPVELVHVRIDSVNGGYFRMDALNGAPGLQTYGLRGTVASPTATQSGDFIGLWGMRGYGTSYITGSRAYVAGKAAENWTATNQGAYMYFGTTPKLSVTVAERLRIDEDGNIIVAAATGIRFDATIGTLAAGSIRQLVVSGELVTQTYNGSDWV